MKAIRLTQEVSAEPKSSLVKRAALTVFGTTHAVIQHAHKVPSQLHQTVDDIQSAWRETYRPNV